MTDADPFAGLRNTKAAKAWRAHCFARAKRLEGDRKRAKPTPHDPRTFTLQGGMAKLEHVAGAAAAASAIRFEQRHWYRILKLWLADPDLHPIDRDQLGRELKRLRRILGIRQTKKEKRAKTLERVRRYRAAKLR